MYKCITHLFVYHTRLNLGNSSLFILNTHDQSEHHVGLIKFMSVNQDRHMENID